MKRANSANIAGERFEMSMTASPACLVFTLLNIMHKNFWNQFNPSKALSPTRNSNEASFAAK
jgi:hypothetical protein